LRSSCSRSAAADSAARAAEAQRACTSDISAVRRENHSAVHCQSYAETPRDMLGCKGAPSTAQMHGELTSALHGQCLAIHLTLAAPVEGWMFLSASKQQRPLGMILPKCTCVSWQPLSWPATNSTCSDAGSLRSLLWVFDKHRRAKCMWAKCMCKHKGYKHIHKRDKHLHTCASSNSLCLASSRASSSDSRACSTSARPLCSDAEVEAAVKACERNGKQRSKHRDMLDTERPAILQTTGT
jgi:hypothetical protein